MSFASAWEKAKKEGRVGGSGFYKPENGDNVLRIISDTIEYQSPDRYHEGETRSQFLCYIIDRSDSRIKPYLMPPSVMEKLVNLQRSKDAGFEELPPYDVILTKTKKGDKVSYSSLRPSLKGNTSLTEREKAEIEKLKPLEQILERLEAKQEKMGSQQISEDEGYSPTSEELEEAGLI